ncbi:MAG: hypothetical protein AB7P22_14920 [Vicinamibacterales bacterium]
MSNESELMGRNQYARHRGVSPNAVAKAAKDGRITKAVIWRSGKIESIRWRQADELWAANTDPAQALRIKSAKSSGEPGTEDRLQEALGRACGRGFIVWAGLLVYELGITPEQAVRAVTGLHLVVATAITDALGCTDPENARVLITGDLAAALVPANMPRIIEDVRQAAAVYAEHVQLG